MLEERGNILEEWKFIVRGWVREDMKFLRRVLMKYRRVVKVF